MLEPVRPVVAAAILALLASLSGGPLAGEPEPQAERFTGTIMVVNGPRTGVARIRITVERWTTDEQRSRLVEALRSGGTEALVKAMDGMEAGYVQIDDNLRWPIRSASSWTTDKGRLVRFATNRPINFIEGWNATRSLDYPIGVAEVLLRLDGKEKGEGVLLVATQVRFDADGRLEVKSLPSNTGPQKITNVEGKILKPKKSKKK